MNEIYLSKFLKHKKNSLEIKCYLYIKTKWNDQDMEITLQDSETDKCYHGLVTTEYFQKVANDLEISYSEYKQICKQLLTTKNYGNDSNNCRFIYELMDDSKDNNENGKLLLIRKLPINCLYLDINLKDIKNHYDIFDTALELLHNKDISLMQQIHIAQNHDKHYKEVHENMERMIDEKNQLEKTLLKKVLALLNAKKERILELETRLKMYTNEQNDNDSDNTENSSNGDVPETSRICPMITTDIVSGDKCNDESGCVHNESCDEHFIADTEILNLS